MPRQNRRYPSYPNPQHRSSPPQFLQLLQRLPTELVVILRPLETRCPSPMSQFPIIGPEPLNPLLPFCALHGGMGGFEAPERGEALEVAEGGIGFAAAATVLEGLCSVDEAVHGIDVG